MWGDARRGRSVTAGPPHEAPSTEARWAALGATAMGTGVFVVMEFYLPDCGNGHGCSKAAELGAYVCGFLGHMSSLSLKMFKSK